MNKQHGCIFHYSIIVMFLMALLMTVTCQARPHFHELGSNIADKGSDFYRFRHFELDSADGKRHYRVWVGVPRKAPPKSGYSVLYALDGNSVMDRLDDAILGRLGKGTPPVIVAIGYQTSMPFDSISRSIDYTPPSLSGNGSAASVFRGRQGGGSHQFRQLLLDHIQPQAEKGLSINPKQRALWGHSFGGLFVLDTLFNTPEAFSDYYPASPSLGSNAKDYFAAPAVLLNKLKSHHSIIFFLDTAMRKTSVSKDASSTDKEKVHDKSVGMKPVIHAREQFIMGLTSLDLLKVTTREYPHLTHGAMFPISLLDVLDHLAGQPMSDSQTIEPLPYH